MLSLIHVANEILFEVSGGLKYRISAGNIVCNANMTNCFSFDKKRAMGNENCNMIWDGSKLLIMLNVDNLLVLI